MSDGRPWIHAVAAICLSCSHPADTPIDVPVPAPQHDSKEAPAEIGHRSEDEHLAFVPVDDENDVLAPYAEDQSLNAAIPSEIRFDVEHFRSEHVGWTQNHYAEIRAIHGETLDIALGRGVTFLAAIAIPRGEHFAFQYVSSFDDQGSTVSASYHSFLLYNKPVITGRDVTEAVPRTTDGDPMRWEARLTLSADGAERFRRYTATHIGRRMAVVLDGVVQTAPIIAGEIGGGHLSIAVGGNSLEEQRANVESVCRVLATRKH